MLRYAPHASAAEGESAATLLNIGTRNGGRSVDGLFSQIIQIEQATLERNQLYWSAVIDGAEFPRQLVTSVPFAMRANSALESRRLVNGFSIVNGHAISEKKTIYIQNPGGVSDRNTWGLSAFAGDGAFGIGPSQAAPSQGVVDRLPLYIEHGAPNLALHVTGSGDVSVARLVIRGGSDLAEPFRAAPHPEVAPVPGMVLAIDPANPGALRVCDEAYDTRVAGVYSGGNGLPTGLVMSKEGDELAEGGEGTLPLVMTGRVWVFADESNGKIIPGDRLTTSARHPGHAMKATDKSRCDGSVIGKAMTPIDPASGMVLELVNLQ